MPAGGTVFGWPAGVFILLAADADYPDLYMTIHFIMVSNLDQLKDFNSSLVHLCGYC